jgi:septum formation protein
MTSVRVVSQAQPAAYPVLTLASASPRRHELLALLGLAFVVAPNAGEDQDDQPPDTVVAALPPCSVPLRQHPTLLAWRKVAAACIDTPSDVIIGADTDVVIDGEVLGKPRDSAHACALLARLAGRTHTVYSGLCVWQAATEAFTYALVRSDVVIAPLSDDEIAAYVATGEPLDKAGAYGIQGMGGRLVQQVHGSYTAVVGLPLVTTAEMLRAAGLHVLVDPVDAYYRWLQAQRKEPLPCPPTSP